MKGFICAVKGQEGLGAAYIVAESSGKARYACALGAKDAGYIDKASPHLIKCKREPQLDGLPIEPGTPFTPEYIALVKAARRATIVPHPANYHDTSD